MAPLQAEDHPGIFTGHAHPEQRADLGEIRMNYATAGRADLPALVLVPGETPPSLLTALAGMAVKKAGAPPPDFSVPPQNMREYDPEWARAFWSGTATVNCDHALMLASVRTPVLYTHHFRTVDPGSGAILGAASDEQVARARELVTGAGQPFEIVSRPEMAHAMHAQDPELFARLLADWAKQLDPA